MSNKSLLYCLVACTFIFASCTRPPQQPEEEVLKPAEAECDICQSVKLDSGLSFEVIKASASQRTPQKGQKVTVHYAGWLQDSSKADAKGKKFDSSVDRGQKFTFTLGVGQVIKGWDEGVAGMKVGEKRKLVIPHHLAYGQNGIPGVIPPKSTLIFEVELFDIS